MIEIFLTDFPIKEEYLSEITKTNDISIMEMAQILPTKFNPPQNIKYYDFNIKVTSVKNKNFLSSTFLKKVSAWLESNNIDSSEIIVYTIFFPILNNPSDHFKDGKCVYTLDDMKKWISNILETQDIKSNDPALAILKINS
jgi:hypothetical protein